MAVTPMNLPTKWSYNPSFADKLAKFCDEILLRGEKRLVFETQYFPWGLSHPLHLSVATVLLISIKKVKSAPNCIETAQSDPNVCHLFGDIEIIINCLLICFLTELYCICMSILDPKLGSKNTREDLIDQQPMIPKTDVFLRIF